MKSINGSEKEGDRWRKHGKERKSRDDGKETAKGGKEKERRSVVVVEALAFRFAPQRI